MIVYLIQGEFVAGQNELPRRFEGSSVAVHIGLHAGSFIIAVICVLTFLNPRTKTVTQLIQGPNVSGIMPATELQYSKRNRKYVAKWFGLITRQTLCSDPGDCMVVPATRPAIARTRGETLVLPIIIG